MRAGSAAGTIHGQFSFRGMRAPRASTQYASALPGTMPATLELGSSEDLPPSAPGHMVSVIAAAAGARIPARTCAGDPGSLSDPMSPGIKYQMVSPPAHTPGTTPYALDQATGRASAHSTQQFGSMHVVWDSYVSVDRRSMSDMSELTGLLPSGPTSFRDFSVPLEGGDSGSQSGVPQQGSAGPPSARSAHMSRRRFYDRLRMHAHQQDMEGVGADFLQPPRVLLLPGLPWAFALQQEDDAVSKSSRISSIFNMANLMMGSTIWAMPWAVSLAGFWGSALVLGTIGIVAWYTVTLVAHAGRDGRVLDLSKLFSGMSPVLGMVTSYASIAVMLIATSVYTLLVSDALYDLGRLVIDRVTGHMPRSAHHATQYYTTDALHFAQWTPGYAGLLAQAVILPLSSLREFTVIGRLSIIATLCFAYMFLFIILVSVGNAVYGIGTPSGAPRPSLGERASSIVLRAPWPSFGWVILMGLSSLGLLIHNAILPFVRSHPRPEYFARDLGWSFFIVAGMYFALGAVGYFGYYGTDLPQNFLTMFPADFVPAIIARIALVAQLILVMPILMFIQRQQCLTRFGRPEWPGLTTVLALNIVLLAISILPVYFLPHLGTLIRFTAPVFGGYLMFTAPVLLQWEGRLSGARGLRGIVGALIIIFGVAIVIMQFFVP